jgi:multidrug efflux pump subunit AcrB
VIEAVFVPTQAGGSVPLASVARLELERSPTTIRHHDKERSTTVSAFPLPGFNTDRVTKDVLARLEKVALPRGVRLVPAGEIESRSESFGGLGTAVLVAAFGVLAVLVLEFRTFRGTAIVASVIPLGIIGGMVALYVTGNTLSFTANIGFVALMGIEVKNSILLVDFTNQLRAEGVPMDEAIRRAGETRFVPILLTTLTAVGGLLPLALERSPLYSPLAIVILGGLLSSTVLTRVVTPVLYKLLAPEIEPDDAAPAPPSLAGQTEQVAHG